MLEELADRIGQYDILFVINTESVPRSIFDFFKITNPVAAKLYVKPEKFGDLSERLASLSHEGMLNTEAIESLKSKIAGKPKVSTLDTEMEVEGVHIPGLYQDLLNLLANDYRVCILADPSIRPADSAVQPQAISGFKEYGMLWLDQNTRVPAGTLDRYIGLGPVKFKWYPKKFTAPSVRLTETFNYEVVPKQESNPCPVQIFPLDPKL